MSKETALTGMFPALHLNQHHYYYITYFHHQGSRTTSHSKITYLLLYRLRDYFPGNAQSCPFEAS